MGRKGRKKKKGLNHFGKLDGVLLVLLTALTLTTILPFWQTVMLSFADGASYAQHPMYLLPYSFDVTGYRAIFGDKRFFSSLAVTLFVTIVGTSLNMILSVTGAYVLSRKKLVGRKFFLNMILFTMLFGGGMIPTYMVMKGMGLVNNILVLILPTAISTYYLIIMKNYFLSLPESLLEAAHLDGANEFQILGKVVIPISKPFMATFFLFYAVERWNEWYLCNLYINKSALYTLQIYLRNTIIGMDNTLNEMARQYLEKNGMVNTVAVRMAAIVVTTVPILCVYPFVQKHFVKGVMVGSIKE